MTRHVALCLAAILLLLAGRVVGQESKDPIQLQTELNELYMEYKSLEQDLDANRERITKIAERMDQILNEPAADSFLLEAAFASGEISFALGDFKKAAAAYRKFSEQKTEDENMALSAHVRYTEALTFDCDYASLKSHLAGLKKKNPENSLLRMWAERELKYVGELGKPAKRFSMTDLNGKVVDLSAFSGKIVLLDFWATWCGPCVAEMPNVVNVYQKYKDRKFALIGVSLDKDKDAVKQFIEANRMEWPILFDGQAWKMRIAVLYDVHSIPMTYLIDEKGIIRCAGARGDLLNRAVRSLLVRMDAAKSQPQASDDAAAKECEGWLNMAQNFEKNNLPESAKEYYQKIVANYPDSKYAETARERLKALEGNAE